MRKGFFWWLIVWTGLTAVSQQVAWGIRASGETADARVGFELYRDYLIVVRGSAGSAKGLKFLLDTGTSPSILDRRVAQKLHLKVAPAEIAVLNGNVEGGWSTVPSLGLGPVRKQNLTVLIKDLSFVQKAVPVSIDGILGLDLLGDSSFVIDYASREIRFGPAPAMPASIPLEVRRGLAIVNATANHATVHLLLDTGAPSLILFEQMPPPAGSEGSLQPGAKAIGDSERRQLRLSSFSLGETNFGRKQAFIVHNSRDTGHDFDGLMSPAALGITRVAVDLTRGTLAFAREP
jgi:Aspartyl protease